MTTEQTQSDGSKDVTDDQLNFTINVNNQIGQLLTLSIYGNDLIGCQCLVSIAEIWG